MGAEEILAGFVHSGEVEAGEAALPGVGGHEGVFLAVDEVGIGTLHGAEACVKVVGNGKDGMDRDGTRQDGI